MTVIRPVDMSVPVIMFRGVPAAAQGQCSQQERQGE
jgi:hypothetical protein